MAQTCVVVLGLPDAALQTDGCNAGCSLSVLTQLDSLAVCVQVGWVCVDKAGQAAKHLVSGCASAGLERCVCGAGAVCCNLQLSQLPAQTMKLSQSTKQRFAGS